MANLPSSTIDDQQERHFIGSLLFEEDVFGQPNANRIDTNATSQLPAGSVLPSAGPLGPSPNQAFWPEPPPPYSPCTASPPQWASLNRQPAGLFGPPVASLFGQSPTATAVTRTDFYQAPYNRPGPGEWDPVTGAPLDSYSIVGSGIPYPPHGSIQIMKPMLPGGGPLNPVQHHYHNMYHHHHSVVNNRFVPPNVMQHGTPQLPVGFPGPDPSAALHVDTLPPHRIPGKGNKKPEIFTIHFGESAPNSPTSPVGQGTGLLPPAGKSYRDVASNKQRVISSSSATSVISNSAAPVRHTSSSSSGGNGTPVLSARRVSATHRNTNERHSSGDSVLEVTTNSSATADKGVVGLNPVEKTSGGSSKRTGENEFQKITHKKSKGSSKGGKSEQIVTDEDGLTGNQAVDASSRFDVLQSLSGQPASVPHDAPRRSTSASSGVQQDAVKFGKGLKTVGDAAGQEAYGRSERSGDVGKSSCVENQSEEIRTAGESTKLTSLSQRSGTRKSALGSRREGNEQSIVDGQRSGGRKQRGSAKKRRSSALDYLNVILLAVFSLLKRGAQWIVDLVVDISLQLRDITVYVAFSTYTSVTFSCQRLWYSSLERLGSFWTNICNFNAKKLWTAEEDDTCEWGLSDNIQLPSTGAEAMERLLRCHGQDAYVVLGLRADCNDDDIKRYYKRQAVLVHPDKNHSNGADEAFKILSTAFDAIGTPEARVKYNMANLHKNPLHKEMEELWERLREKMNEARNTMHCDCGNKHTRVPVEGIRPQEARYCKKCRLRHQAKHNDIWAETRFGGLWWVYYACLDGVVYDVTQWATCPNNRLKHMKANSHAVQYRFVSTAGPSAGKGDSTSKRFKKSMQHEVNDFDCLDNECGMENGCGYPMAFGGMEAGSASQQASYRPPERRALDADRPRRAGRRRKLR